MTSEPRAALASVLLCVALGCGESAHDSASTSSESATTTADPASTSAPTAGVTSAPESTASGSATETTTSPTTGDTATTEDSTTGDASTTSSASTTGDTWPALPGCPLDWGATADLQGTSSLGVLDGFAFAWWTDKYFAEEQGWRPVLFVFADPAPFAAAAVAGEEQGLFTPPDPYLWLDPHMADVPDWIGTFPVTAAQTAPDNVSGAGILEIEAIDWPPAPFLPDTQPVITGSVLVEDVEDNFSLAGTFKAPYCAHLQSPPAP